MSEKKKGNSKGNAQEVILCALGIAGILSTGLVISTGEIFWYHWIAFIAFMALIPLSSMFRERS